MSYVAVGQQQLGHVEQALEIAQAAREKAHGQRFLDAELDACNQHALLLFWKGRRHEAIELLTPQLPLLSLSGNALLAAQAEALVRQSETRETWIHDPPWSWPDELPMPARLPAVPGVHILTGRARRHARVDLKEAAHVLAPAIRQCEELRRTSPEDQRSRFLVQFRNVYSLFLDLPMFDALAPDEFLELLRTVIALFDYDELQADRSLARALLQIHYARHGQQPSGRDKIETLLVETILDPHNAALQMELAWSHLEQDDLYAARAAVERSLELEENWSAYRVLGHIAFRSGLYKDAFEHFQSAAACTASLPDEVTLEYAEMARLADQPARAIEILAPRAAAIATPTAWTLLATCYSALGDFRSEADCLVRFLAMKPPTDAHTFNALRRLQALGRLEELQSTPPSDAAREPTAQPSRKKGSGGIDDPGSYRPCGNCGRVVYDIGITIGKHALMDAGLARISGVTCGGCERFSCVVPCSLRGTDPMIRLCPMCREFLTGVLPDVD
jgi:tetratricopeptide (TPR) repeat protein